ncbi:MAG: DNA alkylation repair protein [Erysipelotrichaceae bacterium]|nr:DNA alkylation repair protein [Erysipelotrichaceae bacterium]
MSDVKEWLYQQVDMRYQDFSSRITTTGRPILGIRLPLLHKKAKELAKQYGYDAYTMIDDTYMEEVLLKGFVLGYTKPVDWSVLMKYIENYISLTDSWCTVDTFCSCIRPVVNRNRELFRNFVMSLKEDNREYVQRYRIVTMMIHFLDDAYIEESIEEVLAVPLQTYYTDMAKAWFLATAFVSQKEKIKKVCKKSVLGKSVFTKTCQKLLDSYRVSDADKQWVRQIRKEEAYEIPD